MAQQEASSLFRHESSSPFADPEPANPGIDTCAPPAYTNQDHSSLAQSSTLARLNAHEEKERLRQQLRQSQSQVIQMDTSLYPVNANQPAAMPYSLAPGFFNFAPTRPETYQAATHKRIPTSSFPYPSVLVSSGITTTEWSLFTREINEVAKMRAGGWTLTIATTWLTAAVLNFLTTPLVGIPVGVITYRKMRRTLQYHNLEKAKDRGQIDYIVERWNQRIFMPHGWVLALDVRGDISGTKAAAARAATGKYNPFNATRRKEDRKTRRQMKKTYDRTRITLIPITAVIPAAVAPTTDGNNSPTNGGQNGSSPVDNEPDPAIPRQIEARGDGPSHEEPVGTGANSHRSISTASSINEPEVAGEREVVGVSKIHGKGRQQSLELYE